MDYVFYLSVLAGVGVYLEYTHRHTALGWYLCLWLVSRKANGKAASEAHQLTFKTRGDPPNFPMPSWGKCEFLQNGGPPFGC